MVSINDESQQCYYAANFTLKMLWQGGRDVVAAEQQVQQGQRDLLQGDSGVGIPVMGLGKQHSTRELLFR